MSAALPAQAQDRGPFVALAGQWSGTGTVELNNGSSEKLRCRASYDVLREGANLQLNIRCASESYNFDLRSSVDYSGGNISGTWSESTRNAAGTLTGKASGRRIDVSATGTIAVSLSLTTSGDHQSVNIRAQDQQSSVKGATISLKRG
ncbi:MAG TPA: hypothetical protein VFB45_07555 [Pseudolabrys sp.]|nr:hypothetical protein [Pseudolabrys sp.]